MSIRRQLVTVLAAATVAVVSAQPQAAGAAGCAHADAAPHTATRAAIASAVGCAINGERTRHGLAPLTVDESLASAALAHSRDMVRRHYFRHITRGDGPAERAMRAGYLDGANRWLIGETLAWGWGPGASAHRIVESWMRSPEHRRVLLRPDYRELGVGVIWGGPHPRAQPDATFTANFGVIG